MPRFGAGSLAELGTCDEDLQKVMNEAIKYFDFKVMEGHRGQQEQDAAVADGNSKTPWPTSKHNGTPSKACDCAPYPVDWTGSEAARQRFVFMAGVITTCARQLGIKIRWGGDWNQNDDTRDEPKFRDFPHFELV